VNAPLSPRQGAPFARILGVGGYRPTRVVTNDEICRYIDSSDEWIRERTGIITRHFADADETVVDMSAAASAKALASAGIAADQIDTVIVSTVTHLSQTPRRPSWPSGSAPGLRPRSTSAPRVPASATASRSPRT
jgi:3-oxoacyl-[acyl-carrier-protein] synthase-3